ncbi:MAG TPA: hypothetical protein VK663_14270, partial [Burkholderiales bacterium]|nr:hypothetical protein [Burkholderiales bacterium]
MRAAVRARVGRFSVVAVTIFLLAALGLAANGLTQQITLTIDDITGAGLSAKGIRVDYAGAAVVLNISAVNLGTQSWKNVKLNCAALKLEHTRIACDDGVLALAEKIPLTFSYRTDKRMLDITLKPSKDETWQLSMRPGKRGSDLAVRIDGGRVQRVAAWLPPNLPKFNAGVVNADITYNSEGEVAAKLALTGAAFA